MIRSVRSRPLSRGWVLVAGYLAYTAWYAVCFYLALARAAELAGRWYVPAVGDVYTADVDIWSGWPWADVVTFTLSTAPMVPAVALLLSIILFLLGQTSGRRALTIALISGTAVILLPLVVSVTPAGQSVTGWLLD